MNKLRGLGDAVGVLASALCLVHCLAAPLLLLAVPVLGGERGESGFHQAMVGAALFAALAGLAPGWLAHRRALVPLLGAAGIGCLATAVFAVGPSYGEAAETWLSIAGALLLATAHLRNRACCRCCRPANAG